MSAKWVTDGWYISLDNGFSWQRIGRRLCISDALANVTGDTKVINVAIE